LLETLKEKHAEDRRLFLALAGFRQNSPVLRRARAAINEKVTAEQMRGMLVLRQAEQQVRVEEERDRLGRLESRIRLIEQETSMPQEVILKEVPKQWIASTRETIANYPSIGMLYPELFTSLGPNMAQMTMCVALWHDLEHKDSDVDAEAGVYLQAPVEAADGIRVYELPNCTAASIIHAGSYQRLPEAYDALLRWVVSNGYQVAASIRELYLHSTMPVRQDDESYVTEIQVPVSKAPAGAA
jgi:effector-binding domain-containing protein